MDNNYCILQEKEASFSSILLDSIYNNSIDENIVVLQNMKKKEKKKNTSFERVFKVENWMDKQQLIIDKEFVRLDFERRKCLRNDIKSSSSSTVSTTTTTTSCGGGGFSSEDEKSSGHDGVNNYAKEVNFFKNERERRDRCVQQGSSSITRTKAKALKIYRDLKKLKPPLSPGGGGGGGGKRVTSFLNSIFIAGNTKKTNISSNYDEIGSERNGGSNCSSASSYSRSCLIKNPSSREKSSNNGNKRSVRFCPNNVILDDDDNGSTRFKPNAVKKEPKVHPMEKNNHHMDDESTRELLINIKRNQEFRDIVNNEDEENDSSCSSSDLFELNNLFDIGGNAFGKSYLQELPVYETTTPHSNKF